MTEVELVATATYETSGVVYPRMVAAHGIGGRDLADSLRNWQQGCGLERVLNSNFEQYLINSKELFAQQLLKSEWCNQDWGKWLLFMISNPRFTFWIHIED